MITRTSKFNGIRKTIHGTIKDMKTVIVKNDIQVFQQPNQQESNTLLIVAAIICLIIPPLLPIFLLYLGCKYAPNAMVGLVILTIILSACAGGMFYYSIYQEQIQQQKTQHFLVLATILFFYCSLKETCTFQVIEVHIQAIPRPNQGSSS